MKLFTNFNNDESGAVTVDWVVLTAAVIGMTLSLFATLSPTLTEQGGNIVERAAISVDF